MEEWSNLFNLQHFLTIMNVSTCIPSSPAWPHVSPSDHFLRWQPQAFACTLGSTWQLNCRDLQHTPEDLACVALRNPVVQLTWTTQVVWTPLATVLISLSLHLHLIFFSSLVFSSVSWTSHSGQRLAHWGHVHIRGSSLYAYFLKYHFQTITSVLLSCLQGFHKAIGDRKLFFPWWPLLTWRAVHLLPYQDYLFPIPTSYHPPPLEADAVCFYK